MRTAQDIINNARFELVTHIVTLMRKLDAYLVTGSKKVMTSSEESVVIADYDLVAVPAVRVEVDNSYLDVEDRCFEPRLVESIYTSDDHNFTVTLGESEIDADGLSTDDLLTIAKALEDTYNKK
jgi:hypothetical protein